MTPNDVATAEANSAEAGETVAASDAPIVMTESKFFFKKDKELGTERRPTVTLQLPFLTLSGLLEKLTDEKVQKFVLDTVNEQVVKAAREQVADDEKPVNSQEQLDLSKLDLTYLANLPPTERRGGGIAKEVWKEFAEDYVQVMTTKAGKTAEQAGNAAKLLLAKFQPIKTNKPVLTKVREMLAFWFANTENKEDFAECFEFLDQKADTLLKADEAALLANL